MKHPQSMNASTMRIVLSVVLFLILGAMMGGFYMAYSYLQKTAEEVAQVQAEAEASRNKLQNILDLKEKLADNKDGIEKIDKIVADSQSYKYQNQVIDDILVYSRKTGIPIMSFAFSDASSSTTAKAPAAAPTGVKPTTVTITLPKDVNYVQLLTFIHLLEQNLTRTQISNLTLTRGSTPQTANTTSLNLELFLK